MSEIENDGHDPFSITHTHTHTNTHTHSLTQTHTYRKNHKLSLWNTHTLLSTGIDSSISRVQRLRRQTTLRHLMLKLRTFLFPYPRKFESHTKFCMITKLCCRPLFNTMNHNYTVQRQWIAKASHHNRTNLSPFILETKRPSIGNVRF
jgi:hypothetical protein